MLGAPKVWPRLTVKQLLVLRCGAYAVRTTGWRQGRSWPPYLTWWLLDSPEDGIRMRWNCSSTVLTLRKRGLVRVHWKSSAGRGSLGPLAARLPEDAEAIAVPRISNRSDC